MILRGDLHVVYHLMDPITLETGTTGTRDGFIPAGLVANHLPFLVNCDKGALHQRRPDPEIGFNERASSLHPQVVVPCTLMPFPLFIDTCNIKPVVFIFGHEGTLQPPHVDVFSATSPITQKFKPTIYAALR